ncbi:MAG: hypothetical protein AAB886_01290 [Patescibacteria group bacterium]
MKNPLSKIVWVYAAVSAIACFVFFAKVSPYYLSGAFSAIPYLLVGNTLFSAITALGFAARSVNPSDMVVSRRLMKSARHGLILGVIVSISLLMVRNGYLNVWSTILLAVVASVVEWLFFENDNQLTKRISS